MNLIFVDYENVSIKGLSGIENLGDDSIVYLFYSENTAHLPMTTVATLNSSKADMRYILTKVGKNALDFTLASVLGFVIKERFQEDAFYIVSKDKGFDVLVDYWKGNKVTVKVITSLTQISAKKKTAKNIQTQSEADKLKQSLTSKVGTALKGETKDLKAHIVDIIIKCKSKKAVQNSIKQIVKDKTKANNIYTKLTKLIADKK